MSKQRSTALAEDKSRPQKTKQKTLRKNKSIKTFNCNTVQEYIDASQSSSTKRAYASDVRHFLTHGGSIPCTPKRLAKYLAEFANAGLAVATLTRRVTAIHKAHLQQKHPSPARSEIVKQVMQGIRRTLSTKQRQVKPLIKEDLLAALAFMEHRQMPVKAARDQALLLVGFASAMRRSELVKIRMEHLHPSASGIEIELPISKTDQERRGRTVFIPRATGTHCPVTALLHWLTVAGIHEGYVFRAVNRHGQIASQGLSAQSVALRRSTSWRRCQAHQRPQLESWLLHQCSRTRIAAVADTRADGAQVRCDAGQVHTQNHTADYTKPTLIGRSSLHSKG